MTTVFDRAWAFLREQRITGDEDLDRAFIVARLVDKGKTPSDLKEELRAVLDPWFETCLELDEDGDPGLPWDGFDATYRKWVNQPPAVDPAATQSTSAA